MVRWGVIGAGGFADKRPLPGLAQVKEARIEAVMDVERAKELAAKYNAPRYYDKADELIKDKDIDAVYIITPAYLHKELTIKAAREGKHVLCEKPMALKPEEAEEMIRVCRECGVLLVPGFMFRFHTSHLKIKELIDKGTLGKIISARAQQYLWYPDTPGAWRQDPELGGGGCVMDVGCHTMDLLCYFLGEVEYVTAVKDTIAFSYPVEDTAQALLKFKNGAQGMIDVAFSIPMWENFVEVYGTRGAVHARRTIGPFRDPVLRLTTEKGEEDISLPYEDTYTAEFSHFCRCLEEKKEPSVVTARDGLYNLRLIQAVYQSAETGRKAEVK